MKNAVSWFEIPSTQLDKAQAFYEAVLNCKMRREAMGPSEGAVFPYEGEGVGGAVMAGPTAPAPASGGTLVYLDASPSLDAALARVVKGPAARSPCRARHCRPAWAFSRTSPTWTATASACTHWHEPQKTG